MPFRRWPYACGVLLGQSLVGNALLFKRKAKYSPRGPAAQFLRIPSSSSTYSCSPMEEALGIKEGHGDRSVLHDLKELDRILFSGEIGLDSAGVLNRIDSDHVRDSQACSSILSESLALDLPSQENEKTPLHRYEWIYADQQIASMKNPIALRTVGSRPILNITSIARIRSAAEELWGLENQSKSRFTFQRKGNYEAHLTDLISFDPAIKTVMDEALPQMIYTMVRAVLEQSLHQNIDNDLSLCIYDALVIRYNATEANSHSVGTINHCGAGQPLHRDLGLVSVNIMLNPSEDFDGGGTFFENQLLGCIEDKPTCITTQKIQPLKPMGPGHAIAHLSSERHAGAGTTAGVRDILVLFVTARGGGAHQANPLFFTSQGDNNKAVTPALERCARLKAASRGQCQGHENSNAAVCRAFYHRLAIESVPTDGEAWHYLGMALRDYYYALVDGVSQQPLSNIPSHQFFLKTSVKCLKYASLLTPCDGRLYNNLGLALEQLSKLYEGISCIEKTAKEPLHPRICNSYETGLYLHYLSEQAGCDVRYDYDSAILNYGLYLANLDKFKEASNILAQISGHNFQTDDSGHQRIISDAQQLLQFCKQQQ